MGFRFHRRIKILPGVTLNVGKRGISTSVGVRGAHVTFGKNGTRTTVGIPGTGISYTTLAKNYTSSVSGGVGVPYLKRCPYCGHGMRKRWDACPACHRLLVQPPLPTEPSISSEHIHCTRCGAVFQEQPHFCSQCGQKLEECTPEIDPVPSADVAKLYEDHNFSVCPHCHYPIPRGKGCKYCFNCGTILPEDSGYTSGSGCWLWILGGALLLGILFL